MRLHDIVVQTAACLALCAGAASAQDPRRALRSSAIATGTGS